MNDPHRRVDRAIFARGARPVRAPDETRGLMATNLAGRDISDRAQVQGELIDAYRFVMKKFFPSRVVVLERV